jgi:DNA-binding beta-propeller fold protein YncE
MFKAIKFKAAPTIVSLLFVACACAFVHPASAPLAAAGIASALLLALVLTIARMASRQSMRRGTPWKRWFLRYAATALLVLLGSGFSWASFSLTFQGLVQTLNTGGSITLLGPSGIAVDAAGNVYIADNGRIVEVNALGMASVLTITGLTPALNNPVGIAIDGSGNLYVADSANNRVVEITPAGVGSAISTQSITLTGPRGVAVDQSGDIFIADTANSRIVEVTSGGTAAVLSITVSSGSATLFSPIGLAVDVTGKLYIADSNNNRIVTVAPGSTTGVVVPILGGVTLSGPFGIAVDRMGNIIIADDVHNRIAEVDTSGNGTVLYTGSATLARPVGVALDVFGTVYIADTNNARVLVVDPPVNADLTSGDSTYSLNRTAVGFGHVPLGSSTAVTLTLPFTTSGSGGLGGVKVFTSGVQGLDFASGTDTTCNGSTGPSTACSVEVTFLPTAPGLRNGAVVLYDADLNPILTVPLYAWADAPVAALSPNVGSIVSTGGLTLSDPFQVALDGAGNIYVGEYGNSTVIKIPAGGGSAAVVPLGTPGGTAAQSVTGVAVDGAGNLFIGDHINSRILVVTPGGVVSVLTINGLSPAIELPTALAFDAAGNLYIADYGGGRIVRVSTLVVAGSTSSGLGTVIGTGAFTFGISTVSGVTVDADGNIYAAARTENNGSIIKVTAAGVASELSFPGITPAISGPQGVAVDAMGNVYVVDSGNKRIVELTTAGVASAFRISGLPVPSALGSSLFGVTSDPAGNLYIPDWTNNRIVKVNVSGAVLTFPDTNVGSTSAPQIATVTNLGDLPLVFVNSPVYTPDFSQPTGASDQCLIATSVAPGTVCDVSVQFTPQSAASLSASIVLTNDNLNVANATQSIAVSGAGLATPDSTTIAVSMNPTAVNLGQALTVTATVTDTRVGHTATVPTGGVTFTDTVGTTSVSLNGGVAVTLNGSGLAILNAVTLSGAGLHTITAVYPGVSGAFLASAANNTVLVTAGPVVPTIVWTAPAGGITYGATLSGVLNASAVNESTAVAGTFTYTATLAGGSPVAVTGATVLGAGSYTLTATFTPADTSAYASTSASVSLTVAKATPAVALTSSAAAVGVGSAAIFTATVSSSAGTPGGSVSYYDGTTLMGTATLSLGVATYTTTSLPVGALSITAVYSGDSNFLTLTSLALTETVMTAFTVTGPATPIMVAPGGSVTVNLTVPPLGGAFNSIVTLSASGLPPGATATFNPPTVTPGSAGAPTVMTIQLASAKASLLNSENPANHAPSNHGGFPVAPFSLAFVLFGTVLGRKRIPQRLVLGLALAVLGVTTLVFTGCGGGFGNARTQAGNYTVTVTGTSGAVQASTTMTLVVE